MRNAGSGDWSPFRTPHSALEVRLDANRHRELLLLVARHALGPALHQPEDTLVERVDRPQPRVVLAHDLLAALERPVARPSLDRHIVEVDELTTGVQLVRG